MRWHGASCSCRKIARTQMVMSCDMKYSLLITFRPILEISLSGKSMHIIGAGTSTSSYRASLMQASLRSREMRKGGEIVNAQNKHLDFVPTSSRS